MSQIKSVLDALKSVIGAKRDNASSYVFESTISTGNCYILRIVAKTPRAKPCVVIEYDIAGHTEFARCYGREWHNMTQFDLTDSPDKIAQEISAVL